MTLYENPLTKTQQKQLLAAAKKATRFVTADTARHAVRGLLFDDKHLVATDGHRLYMHKLDYIEPPPSGWRQTVALQRDNRIPDVQLGSSTIALTSAYWDMFCSTVGMAMECQVPTCRSILDAPKAAEISMHNNGELVGTQIVCHKCFTKLETKFNKNAKEQGYTIEATRGWRFDDKHIYVPALQGTNALVKAKKIQLKEGGIYADDELLGGTIGEFPNYGQVVPNKQPRWQMNLGHASYTKLRAFEDKIKEWNKIQPKEDAIPRDIGIVLSLKSNGDTTGTASAYMEKLDYLVEWDVQVHTLEKEDSELRVGIRLLYLLQAIRAVTNVRSKSCRYVVEFGDSQLHPITVIGEADDKVVTMPMRL